MNVNMNMERGAIYAPQAYAQGKMLDNSGWKLPRRITPSDVDFVLDNNGFLLVGEFSSRHTEWHQLDFGQQLMYQNLVKAGQGRIVAALCKHNVPTMSQIRTDVDVKSFQVMSMEGQKLAIASVLPGDKWLHFVTKVWFNHKWGAW